MNLAGAEIEFQEVEDKEKLLNSCLNQFVIHMISSPLIVPIS